MVTQAGNVQNIKPVQNCTGFIFCTIFPVVHFINNEHKLLEQKKEN